MISAISTAATGLHAAVDQFNAAARTIVNAGTPNTEAGQASTPAASGRPLDRPTLPDLSSDLITPLTDLKRAETSYNALLKVLTVADRLQEKTLDIVS